MKIMIAYPPLISEKGVALLSQNRQFQWFSDPTFIYPVVPAQAASLLKSLGHDVIWADGIAESKTQEEFWNQIKNTNPDLIVLESKTPVIKRHWNFVNEIKKQWPKMIVVLVGDHVTAEPEESMEKCKVDYILTGGNYDFLLKNLIEHIEKRKSLEPGIWYRLKNQKSKIKNQNYSNSGKFMLNHDLNELPPIDRDLTKWELYAYKNGNFKYTPGTYIMAARDCWWGKCTFCLPAKAKINTTDGFINIENIVKNKLTTQVLSHTGTYQNILQYLYRKYDGEMIELELDYLSDKIQATSNHRVFVFRSNKIISTEIKNLKTGEKVILPINRKIKDVRVINLTEILNKNPIQLKTWQKISKITIEEIFKLKNLNYSQRAIAKTLKIDRETVKRYFTLFDHNEVQDKYNPITKRISTAKFEGGKKFIREKIKLSNSFMRLIGYYLAEGHINWIKSRKNSAMIGLTFFEKEIKFINDVQKIFSASFGTTLSKTHNQKNHTTQLYFGSSYLARAFQILFGDNSLNKKIPEKFMYLPLSKQKQLLLGLFRGDGHIRKDRNSGGQEFIFDTASEQLAYQVYNLLLRQNIVASFRKPKFGKKTKHQNYSIHIYGKDIKKIFTDYKLKNVAKRPRKGFIKDNYAYIPIKKITRYNYKGKVYNLNIQNNHSYTANFMAVKNCSWTTLYPNYRRRSVKNVLDEIGTLINKYHIKEIMDDSGTFPAGKWLKDFCHGMIKRGYNKKVVMDCNMRFGILTQSDWNLMKKAGFRFILFGFESANQKTLDKIKKNIKIKDIENGLRMAKQAKLEPHITAMIGYPWESKQDAQNTIDFAKKMFDKGYIDTLQATIVIPYPGTPLYKYCKENNLLKFTDYDRFDQREQVMKSPLSTQDVQDLTSQLYKSFLTPKFVFKKIMSIRNWEDVKFLFRAAGKVWGHLTDFSNKNKCKKCENENN